MLVKTHYGDGQWALFEAEGDVTYLGPNIVIDIPAHEDHDFWEDERFPTWTTLHMLVQEPTPEAKSVFVRWVRWITDEVEHLLVTDQPVYLCNMSGDTIEALR